MVDRNQKLCRDLYKMEQWISDPADKDLINRARRIISIYDQAFDSIERMIKMQLRVAEEATNDKQD